MAYEKHTWVCGETITAELLNNIEGGVEQALECCGDKGYECIETQEVLTSESVTTAAQGDFNIGRLAYPEPITADTIIVTFDGTEYECNATEKGGVYYYGGVSETSETPDFSEYPFVIVSEQYGNDLVTENAGTYSVKIETLIESIDYTECFLKAVRKALEEINTVHVTLDDKSRCCDGGQIIAGSIDINASAEELMTYLEAGKTVIADAITSETCGRQTTYGGEVEVAPNYTDGLHFIVGGRRFTAPSSTDKPFAEPGVCPY